MRKLTGDILQYTNQDLLKMEIIFFYPF